MGTTNKNKAERGWRDVLFEVIFEADTPAGKWFDIVHSPDDRLIPYQHAQRLFAAAQEPKQFLELRGGHNEGFILSAQVYETGLDTFITSLPGISTSQN